LQGRCGICEYRAVCGGCRARALGATGNYLDEEPFCTYQPNPRTPRELVNVEGLLSQAVAQKGAWKRCRTRTSFPPALPGR